MCNSHILFCELFFLHVINNSDQYFRVLSHGKKTEGDSAKKNGKHRDECGEAFYGKYSVWFSWYHSYKENVTKFFFEISFMMNHY